MQPGSGQRLALRFECDPIYNWASISELIHQGSASASATAPLARSPGRSAGSGTQRDHQTQEVDMEFRAPHSTPVIPPPTTQNASLAAQVHFHLPSLPPHPPAQQPPPPPLDSDLHEPLLTVYHSPSSLSGLYILNTLRAGAGEEQTGIPMRPVESDRPQLPDTSSAAIIKIEYTDPQEEQSFVGSTICSNETTVKEEPPVLQTVDAHQTVGCAMHKEPHSSDRQQPAQQRSCRSENSSRTSICSDEPRPLRIATPEPSPIPQKPIASALANAPTSTRWSSTGRVPTLCVNISSTALEQPLKRKTLAIFDLDTELGISSLYNFDLLFNY